MYTKVKMIVYRNRTEFIDVCTFIFTGYFGKNESILGKNESLQDKLLFLFT